MPLRTITNIYVVLISLKIKGKMFSTDLIDKFKETKEEPEIM